MDKAWSMLRTFPKEMLKKIPADIIEEFYARKGVEVEEEVAEVAEEVAEVAEVTEVAQE